MENTEKQPPIISRKDKGISFSVFKRNSNGKDYYAISLQRSYKKKDDTDWTRETIHLFADDLLVLSNLAQCTYTDLVALQRKKAKAEVKQAWEKSQGAELPDSAFDDPIPFE